MDSAAKSLLETTELSVMPHVRHRWTYWNQCPLHSKGSNPSSSALIPGSWTIIEMVFTLIKRYPE